MNRMYPAGDSSLPVAAMMRIDALCQRFEAAFQAAPGGAGLPRIEDYLGPIPADEAPALLRELIKLDLHHRRAERPSLDEYQARFPRHRDLIAGLFADLVQSAEPGQGARTPGETARGAPGVETGHDPNRTARLHGVRRRRARLRLSRGRPGTGDGKGG
jgi:hypothetical protein